MQLDEIQIKLGYTFNDERLLKNAMVHKSYLNEKERDSSINEHNERLEFLGDAVLELIVTDHLYREYQSDEGFLTSLRASLVNYKTMGEIGNDLGLDHQILLSKGEKEELGRARLTIVADCMEAVLGAMYLDGGLEPCVNFIKTNLLIKLEDIILNQLYKDPKTLLQEFSQKHIHSTPVYRVLSSEGKDHQKIFRIGVWVGEEKLSEAEGRSKQDAETIAATIALNLLTIRNQTQS